MEACSYRPVGSRVWGRSDSASPRILFSHFLEAVIGQTKPFSGMIAVAALLALVALVAVDSLLNLLRAPLMDGKRGSRMRVVVGIAIVAAVILRPGITAYVAVETIGAWAVLIGILELAFVTTHGKYAKDVAVALTCSFACIALGIFVMKWVFPGAVFVCAVVGVAAATRGTVLIASGIRERMEQGKTIETQGVGRMAA